MTLNSDQQKRLLAAELAIKTRSEGEKAEDVIANAKKWLDFLDYKMSLVKMDAVDRLKQDLR